MVTIKRKARTGWLAPLFVKLWLVPVWLMLLVARWSIDGLPFKRLAPRLGVPCGALAFTPLTSDRQRQRARQIACVIAMAASVAPWRANCFPQAVVARLLLGIYQVPYVVLFGLAKGQRGAMDAHAWVVSGPITVCGRHSSWGRYAVVGVFSSQSVAQMSLDRDQAPA